MRWRWLLTLTLAAVALLSVQRIIKADKHRGVIANKECDGHRSDSSKEQSGDRSSDKAREKDSENERRMKEEMENEDDRSTSRRFGKSLRASARDGLPFVPQSSHKLGAVHHAKALSPTGGILLTLGAWWNRYISQSGAALASPAPQSQR